MTFEDMTFEDMVFEDLAFAAARLVAIGAPDLRNRLTHPRKQPSSATRFPWRWSIWQRRHHAGATRAAEQKRPGQ
jgi:hypothetical protein